MRTRLCTLVLFSAIVLLGASPTSTEATLLYGHPYAMYYDREVGSPNFDTGVVYMFAYPTGAYAGCARIANPATGGFFARETWESLLSGMLANKLTGIWTDAGLDTNFNDGSCGMLRAFWITIF
jgi:hypothetical protein